MEKSFLCYRSCGSCLWVRMLHIGTNSTTDSYRMHWLASVGTSYRFKEFATNDPATFSRNATAIVVLVLVRDFRAVVTLLLTTG